jgi:hypothetical protein
MGLRVYTYGAVFIAAILTGVFIYCRFTFGNDPLQRFYLPTYIRSSASQGQSERAVETTIGCSCWVLVEFHHVPPRTAT